jgi:Domain of unknown function (DUF1772)
MTGSAALMVRRYRWHTGLMLLLLAAWGFGNLHEAVVLRPQLATLPPGSLVGEFEAGSALFYFVPTAVALLTLGGALVIRLARDDATKHHPGSARWAAAALVLIVLAAVATGVLNNAINPEFRDSGASVGEVRDTLLVWEAGNAFRTALVAGAAACLLRWRLTLVDAVLRRAGPHPADTSL